MPDYKVEIKSAIYKDSIDAKQAQNFNEMMQLLEDKTPEEYIADIDKKLLEAYRLQDEQNSKYEESLNEIEARYKNGIKGYADMTRTKSNELGAPADFMHLCLESMDTFEALWDDKFKGKENDIAEAGLKKVWENIRAEIEKAEESGDFAYYSSTETYKSLNIEEKNLVDRYSSFATEIDKYRSDPDPEIRNKLSEVEEHIKEYNFYKDQYKKMKKDALDSNPEKEKLDTISAAVSSLNKKKEDMQNFMDGQYQQMQDVNISEMEETSKKKGLDMITEARAEYRNNCNFWERIWANILPSSLYSKAAYVEKINAYKEALKETGVNDKEIADANPDKDETYTKNQDGKYVSFQRIDADAIDELNNLSNGEEPAIEQKKDKVRVADVNNEIGKDTGSQEINKDKAQLSKGVKEVNLDKSQKDPVIGDEKK